MHGGEGGMAHEFSDDNQRVYELGTVFPASMCVVCAGSLIHATCRLAQNLIFIVLVGECMGGFINKGGSLHRQAWLVITTNCMQAKYLHMYILTYVHTYIRTYLHTYVHTYIRTYLHTYILTYVWCFEL